MAKNFFYLNFIGKFRLFLLGALFPISLDVLDEFQSFGFRHLAFRFLQFQAAAQIFSLADGTRHLLFQVVALAFQPLDFLLHQVRAPVLLLLFRLLLSLFALQQLLTQFADLFAFGLVDD